MGEYGNTLQTVIISSVLALVAALVGIIIYNIIADESKDLTEAVEEVSDITLFTNDAGEPDEEPDEEPEECATGEIRNDQGECEEEIINSGLPVRGLYSGEAYTCAVIGVSDAGDAEDAEDSEDAEDTENAVWCWGDNSYGQLGREDTRASQAPIQISDLRNMRALSVGHRHACAIIRESDTEDTADTLKCWGLNGSLQIGQVNQNVNILTPTQVLGLKGVQTVSADFRNTCAIAAVLDGANEPTDEDAVYCWGSNNRGQLGVESEESLGFFPLDLFLWEPQLIEELSGKDLKDVAVGENFVCVIIGGDQTDGSADTVWCWGDNNHNQLGDGDSSPTHSTVPIEIAGLTGAKAISTGASHACAIIGGSSPDGSGDTVKCWGSNNRGQLGDTTAGSRFVSTEISDFRGARAVVASATTTCIITSTGSYKCVGEVARDGSDDGANQPEVSLIAPGRSHVCMLYADNSVKCFGDNSRAQIGRTPVAVPYHIPNKIRGTSGAKRVSVGRDIGCFITSSDTLECWGSNQYGQLGLPIRKSNNFRISPVEMSGLTGVTDITNTYFDSYCVIASKSALNSQKDVRCLGRTGFGAIGINPNGVGNDPNQFADETIEAVSNPKAVANLYNHTCAISGGSNPDGSADTVWCWGWNGQGQLLPASEVDSGQLPLYLDPGIQSELIGAKSVSAGRDHSCAIVGGSNPDGSTDTVWCWGDNDFGQLGRSLDKSPNAAAFGPRRVPGLNGSKAVSAGRSHSCVITVQDTVTCWGKNDSAQLGTAPFDTPAVGAFIRFVDVPGLKRVTAISVGYEYTCAIAAVLDGSNNPTSEDAVYCWGDNRVGLVGVPYAAFDSPENILYSIAPVRIQGITDPKGIDTGENQACAIAADLDVDNNPTGEDVIYCWGDFNFGARGTLTIPGTSTSYGDVNRYPEPRQISGL